MVFLSLNCYGRARSLGDEGQGEDRQGCFLAHISPSALMPSGWDALSCWRTPGFPSCIPGLSTPPVWTLWAMFLSIHSATRTPHGTICRSPHRIFVERINEPLSVCYVEYGFPHVKLPTTWKCHDNENKQNLTKILCLTTPSTSLLHTVTSFYSLDLLLIPPYPPISPQPLRCHCYMPVSPVSCEGRHY